MLTRSAYLEFDRLVRSAETWLASAPVPHVGYPDAMVRERLAQRLAEIGLVPFVLGMAQREASHATAPENTDRVDCGPVALCAKTGRVSVAPRYLLRSMLEFLAHWTLGLVAILKGFVARSPLSASPATLLFGVGNESILHRGIDERFVEYCRRGPLPPLQAASQVLAKSTAWQGAQSDPAFIYDRQPLLALARWGRMGIASRAALLLGHMLTPFRFAAAVVRCPLLALLGPDLAVGFIAGFLRRERLLDAVVITNSLYVTQALWMRETGEQGAPLHMVWYSQNTIPFVYAKDGIESDLPSTRHISVGAHWVWTPGYRAYLEKLGIRGAIHVVGPILWYLPERTPRRHEGMIQIAVFDVTPVTAEVARKIGLVENYYSAQTMLAFLRGVITLKGALERDLGRPVRLLLKHKRGYGQAHDAVYIDFVAQESASGGAIMLVPFDANMYSMISVSDLAIVIPYSSPAYVASHLGVPALFFDPTGLLEPTHETGPLLDFASGEQTLLRKAQLAIENNVDAVR